MTTSADEIPSGREREVHVEIRNCREDGQVEHRSVERETDGRVVVIDDEDFDLVLG